MKRLAFFLLSGLAAQCGLCQTFSGGDGSTDNPYLIKTTGDLIELAEVVTGGNTLKDKVLRMENDISFQAGDKFTTIGAKAAGLPAKFAGTFDGNNHSISNLTIEGKRYIGLFASVDETGVIKNLTLQSPTVTSSDSNGGCFAGLMAGTLENCNVDNGSFTTTGGSYKGGLVGTLQKGTVNKCSYSGSISTSVSTGGLVGQNYGFISNSSCSATIVSLTEYSSSTHIGGIASVAIDLYDNSPSISDCYFTGSIQGGQGNNVGGIIASVNESTVQRCWNGGYISSTGTCGGIIGSLDGGTVKDCYNAGTIYDNNSESVGGIFGYSSLSKEYSVENCLSLGSIFNSILARNEGNEIAGSGYNESWIKNTYFDSQTAGWNSKNNGKTTKELSSAAGLSGFDNTVWKFTEGMYPRLLNSSETEIAILNATPFFIADGESHGKVLSDITVSTANDVEWDINGNNATLEGNTIKITRGDKIENVVITSYLGNSQKRALVSIYPIIFEGEGTEASPYLIKSKADLLKLVDASNSQEMSFTGEYFRLTQDIDMEFDATFSPISSASAALAFDGIFDGNGKTIKNLSINTTTSKLLNTALFRTVFKNGVIKNLNIDKSCKFEIYRNFAPFVTYLYGTVDNCRNYADVPTQNGYSAGIATFIEATGVVSNCYNEGNISTSVEKAGNIGGISYSSNGKIENCANFGNITALTGTQLGGIIGYNEDGGQIINAMNAGTVQAKGTAGGICGVTSDEASIKNVLSIAPVIVTEKEFAGSVSGKDEGVSYENAYFDSQIVTSVNSVVSQGVATSDLIAQPNQETAVHWKGFGDDPAWTYTDGRYPVLTSFANENAIKLAIIPVAFNKGETREQIDNDTSLPSVDGLQWTFNGDPAFTIENGLLKLADVDTYSSGVLSASYEGYSKSLGISTLGNILDGEGTQAAPWLISTSADLVKLSEESAKSGNDYAGRYFKFTADIDMAGVTFSPISSDGKSYFNGIIDGNSKTINNLKINLPEQPNVGLFGYVGSQASISKLTIGEGSSIVAKENAGAFAGYFDGQLVECSNKASVSVSGDNAGGFFGTGKTVTALELLNNSGNITATGDNAGGIAGEISAGLTGNANVLSNSGKINGETSVGGLFGTATDVVIVNSSNDGEITGDTHVGGLAGELEGTDKVSGSSNTGNITATEIAAGLVGYNYVSSSGTPVVIEKSFNAGNVDVTESAAAGLLGKGDAQISESFNTGNITNTAEKLGYGDSGAGGLVGTGNPTLTDCYNMGTVTAIDIVGGIIAAPSSSYKEFSITNCYSAGMVIATSETPKSAGSILGKSGKQQITNSFFDRQVSDLNAVGGEDADESGLTTSELSGKNLGENWITTAGETYPQLKSHSDNVYADLYSAPIFLAATEDAVDTYKSVTRTFKLSVANGVKWSADNLFTIDEAGNVTMNASVDGDYKFTAKVNDIERTVTLSIKYEAGGVDGISADSNFYRVEEGGVTVIADKFSIFDTVGRVISSGNAELGEAFISLQKGIYVISTNRGTAKIAIR